MDTSVSFVASPAASSAFQREKRILLRKIYTFQGNLLLRIYFSFNFIVSVQKKKKFTIGD